MARPKESNEMKVKKVYPDMTISDDFEDKDYAWGIVLAKIRKAKIKAAKDKRKQAQPTKVKEIKKHVGLTMYPTDKDMIVKGFGSVQKFLDIAIREYKDKK